MKNTLRREENLIHSLRKSLEPSEETELLRQQLKTLEEYLKKTNFPLYLTVFGESTKRVEPQNSLKTSKKLKKNDLNPAKTEPKSSMVPGTGVSLAALASNLRLLNPVNGYNPETPPKSF